MPDLSKRDDSKKSFFSKLKWFDPFTYVDLFVMPRVKKITSNDWVERLVNVFFAGVFAIIIYLFFGLLFGTSAPFVIIYSESMEPIFYRGDIIGLTKLNEQTMLGKEIFINQNLRNVPVNMFAEPIYKNGSIEKIIFSGGQEFNISEIISNNSLLNNAVIVYQAYPKNIPIIHRSIIKINALDGQFILTKGDNKKTNITFDQDCGRIDQLRLLSEKECITFYAIPVEEIQGVKFFQIPKLGCVKLWLFDNLLSLITIGKLPNDFKGVC